jgi:flagellar M-ring protein FliF
VTVDPQPTALESNTYRKTSESKPASGGRPGAVPNEVPSNTPRDIASISRQESTLDENREEQIAVAGHEQTIRKKAPLIPTTVTATVLVPKSYFRQLWTQENPTPAGEEPKVPDAATLATIEKRVIETITKTVDRTLPPLEPGETQASRVEVSSYQDLPMPTIEPPTLAATTQLWLADNWQRLALIGVGILGLVMLRSMIRSNVPSAPTSSMAIPAAATRDEPEEQTGEPGPAILQRRTNSSGVALRDELTAMVREDPDAAASVLRSWIGDAA